MSTALAPAAVGDRPAAGRGRWALVVLVVAAVAFVCRLVPVLRGGGLYGLIGYDGAVYYAAGAGLAHGLRPYVDFLLLHPPGIVLALAPFGLLGRLVGEPDAMAVARLAWMGLGTLSALLVAAVLRRHGLVPALLGGLLYAVWVPAVYVERTTTLEAVTGVLTVGAVWLLTRPAPAVLTTGGALVAGLLLGAASATKIWAVAPLVGVVVWCAVEHGLRRALVLLAGAVAATVAVCLPFFVGAPRAMWDMVVGAQLGRPRVDVGWWTRAVDTAGLTKVPVLVGPLLVCVTLALVLAVVLNLRSRVGRLALVLLLVGVGVLAASPAWAVDYASLVALPIALLLGLGGAAVTGALVHRPALRLGLVVVLVAAVLGLAALSTPRTTFGSRFAGRTMADLVTGTPGCVTTDDPTALVEADVLGRNIARGCPLVVDLGGYSYYLQPGASRQTSRARNEQWQRFVLDYLRSGGAAVVVRFETGVGLSSATRAAVESWPALGSAGRYVVRRPVP